MLKPRTREVLDKNISLVERKIDNVLGTIKNNPTSDPNACEMNDIMFEVADIGFFGRYYESEAYAFLHDEKYKNLMNKFYTMMNYRIPQFVSEEQGLYAKNLYFYFTESLANMKTLNRLNNDNVENAKQLFNSICSIDLFIHQRRRDLIREKNMSEPIYDNDFENAEISLRFEEYRDNPENEIRPYRMRDAIVSNMYEEIENNYKKTVAEVFEPEKRKKAKRNKTKTITYKKSPLVI